MLPVQTHVQDLEEQLEAETREFNALLRSSTEAQSKLREVEDKTGELQEVLNSKQDELDKKKVIIRRLDMELVKAHPPTEDACLSARSYSENELLEARDAAIQAKERQIVLLNERCEALMDNVTTIEDTIPPLQKQLVECVRVFLPATRAWNARARDIPARRVPVPC